VIPSASQTSRASHGDPDPRHCSGGTASPVPSFIAGGFFSNLTQQYRAALDSIIELSESILVDTAAQSPCGEPRERHDSISRINSASRRLRDILDSAVHTTMMEAGCLPVDMELLCVNGLISEVIERLTPASNQFGISFQTSLDPLLPLCKLDPVRIRQVLRSVIDNAIKYSKPDGVIDVWTSISAQRGIVITIADRGIGISRVDLESIFLPFKRCISTAAGRYSGAGLGLALAKKYVECHGGRIWLTSKLDIGTTVEILLPTGDLQTRLE
jgi:signal transduction histidine kinase